MTYSISFYHNGTIVTSRFRGKSLYSKVLRFYREMGRDIVAHGKEMT